MTRKLSKAFMAQKRKVEPQKKLLYGTLGIPIEGRKTVSVPDRQSFVYVKLRDNQNEVIQAFNNAVAPSYGLPVIVTRDGGRYRIIGVNTERYENNWNNDAPYLPAHGTSHSFYPGGGGDVTWVFSRQFMPGLAYPNPATGTNVLIAPFPLYSNGWILAGNTGTFDLLGYRPTTGSSSLMALIFADASNGNPGVLVGSGSYFPYDITGSVYPYIPSYNPATQIPISAVRLSTGSTSIGWNNLYDVRQWLHSMPSGTAGGGGTPSIDTLGFAGLDKGIPIGTGTILNVDGSRLSFSRSGTVFLLSNSPDPQEIIGIFGQDEGVPLGTGTVLNVVGAGATLTLSGTVLNLSIPGGGGGAGVDQIGIYGENQGVPLGTGTILNVVGSWATLSISGTTLQLDVPPGNSFDNFWTSGSNGRGIRSKQDPTNNSLGDFSFAVGSGAIASGTYSMALGDEVRAIARDSFAEGRATSAEGNASHAAGSNTRAMGQASHSGGTDSIASGTNSFVQGAANTLVGVNSAILGGSLNSLRANRSVMLGGASLSGTYDDTTFVPYLNVHYLQSGTAVLNLGMDNVGNLVTGSSGGGAGVVLTSASPRIYLSGTPTWTKPANLSYIIVELVGGGGGSGAAEGTTSQAAIGGPGGGGEYAKNKILAASLGATENLTVGDGGSAGTTPSNDGGNGGTTSFGTLLTAGGGSGGTGQASSATVPRSGGTGGDGGTGGTGGGLHVSGNSGLNGAIYSVAAGTSSIGGGNPLGGTVRLSSSNEDGHAGAPYGGGACGGRTSNNNTDRPGAAGNNGVIIVWEYVTS